MPSKVAGSNPAPASMNDEGLADAKAANPFRLPRLYPGIGGTPIAVLLAAPHRFSSCRVGERKSQEYAVRAHRHGVVNVTSRSRVSHPEPQKPYAGHRSPCITSRGLTVGCHYSGGSISALSDGAVAASVACGNRGTARTRPQGIRTVDATIAIPYPACASATSVEGAALSNRTCGRMCLTWVAVSNHSREARPRRGQEHRLGRRATVEELNVQETGKIALITRGRDTEVWRPCSSLFDRC